MIPFRRPQRAPRLAQLVHFGGDAVEPLGELVELVDADVQPVEVGADDAADELFEAHACCIDYRRASCRIRRPAVNRQENQRIPLPQPAGQRPV